MKRNRLALLMVSALLVFNSCSKEDETEKFDLEGKALIVLRKIDSNTQNGFGIIDIDPESETFGEMLDEFEVNTVEPPHHIYISPTGRIYSTCLDPQNSLMEIAVAYDSNGKPSISGVNPIDTDGQTVGEDIIFNKVNGKDVFYVTFMGGDGSQNGGSVGKFDASTNELISVLEAPMDANNPENPYIRYPHGISAFGDYMVVTETLKPDLSVVGSSITLIKLSTDEVLQTVQVGEAGSGPVEVLFVRPEIVEDLSYPAVLVNNLFDGKVWRYKFNPDTERLEEATVVYNAGESGLGVGLEFYTNIQNEELFISFGIPGVVKRYNVQDLPELVPSGKPQLNADAGAHHMVFYKTQSGKEVVAVQNNLLNLGLEATDVAFPFELSAHTISVHDVATGERLGTIDVLDKFGRGVENIEGIKSNKFGFHH